MNVEFLPSASIELEQEAVRYESRVTGLGQEFIAEVERVAAVIGNHQQIGRKLDDVHRRMPLQRFPFGLIYRVDPAAIRVVAVAHRRKRPDYWRSRG